MKHRWVASIGVAVMASGTVLLGAPAAALAHGAPQAPISRSVACGPDGGQLKTGPACKAAAQAGNVPAQWDNVRVANVGGQDRAKIPDGKLCSGGVAKFRGLDLPRADWPTTTVTAGSAYTFRYKASIPHPGTFRIYLTRDAFDPAKALTWADLETEPFLTAKDPSRQGDAYVMPGQLPPGKTGRHIIYTIWQNSGPDTYYSCSDVVFEAAATGEKQQVAGGEPTAAPGPAAPADATTPGNQGAAPTETPTNLASTPQSDGNDLLLWVGAAVLVIAIGGAAISWRMWRS